MHVGAGDAGEEGGGEGTCAILLGLAPGYMYRQSKAQGLCCHVLPSTARCFTWGGALLPLKLGLWVYGVEGRCQVLLSLL